MLTDEQLENLVSIAAYCRMSAASLESSMYSRAVGIQEAMLLDLENDVARIRKQMEECGLIETESD